FFPERARRLAMSQKSPQPIIEFFLRFEQTSALRARFQVLLHLKAVFRIQLRIKIKADKFSHFCAFHNDSRLCARRMASLIFCRARERFPITLPSGMPRHSLISRYRKSPIARMRRTARSDWFKL